MTTNDINNINVMVINLAVHNFDNMRAFRRYLFADAIKQNTRLSKNERNRRLTVLYGG